MAAKNRVKLFSTKDLVKTYVALRTFVGFNPSEVKGICQEVLKSESLSIDTRYWAQATEAEAYIGMGDEIQGQQLLDGALEMDVQQWMKDSTQEQLEKLKTMLIDSPLRYIIKE